jgi:16S rRNA (cytidine1402-2'-O)-methyltransferase
LYLIPCGLDDRVPPSEVVPAPVLARIRALDRFVVENAKSARAFLAAAGHPLPIREIVMEVLDEHTPPAKVPQLLAPVLSGSDVGLLSEAGAPAVADPGARLVEAAHEQGVRVVPLVGPSSLLLALMASGLEGQRFRFHGYLPVAAADRRARILEIERESARASETQIFIETPYRNDALLAELVATCRPDSRIAVAASLTSPDEWVRSDTVASWRATTNTLGKRPAVFLLLAQARARR